MHNCGPRKGEGRGPQGRASHTTEGFQRFKIQNSPEPPGATSPLGDAGCHWLRIKHPQLRPNHTSSYKGSVAADQPLADQAPSTTFNCRLQLHGPMSSAHLGNPHIEKACQMAAPPALRGPPCQSCTLHSSRVSAFPGSGLTSEWLV